MVIGICIVCAVIFVAIRTADSAFGEFFGLLISIALMGFIILGVIIFAGAIILPVIAALAVPAIAIWLIVKIISAMIDNEMESNKFN